MSEPQGQERRADELELDAQQVADLEPTVAEQENVKGGDPRNPTGSRDCVTAA